MVPSAVEKLLSGAMTRIALCDADPIVLQLPSAKRPSRVREGSLLPSGDPPQVLVSGEERDLGLIDGTRHLPSMVCARLSVTDHLLA
jgi:hypothetical protein